MSYKCEHFKIQELVSQELYMKLHEDALWSMFDENLLRGIDWLRDQFGPARINTWSARGHYDQSGIRTKGSKHYSEFSQHSIGCAADLKFDNFTPKMIREKLKAMNSVPYITRVEDDTDSWVHVDVKPTGMASLYVFKP